MSAPPPILATLAALYEESTQGQTARAGRDFGVRHGALLEKARCDRGDAYAAALADLERAEIARAIVVQRDRRTRDPQRVLVPLACEAAFYQLLGRTSPTAERTAWAALFEEAAAWPVPRAHAGPWRDFCTARREQVMRGAGWAPFRRGKRQLGRVLLQTLAALLAWRQRAQLRTVSVQISPGSKFLENTRGTLQRLLAEATAGAVKSFQDLGITDNPRSVVFHGPLRLCLGGAWVDYSAHAGPSTLSEDDLARASALECPAPRCVTVENATKFHELARLECGDLFIFTSYPNRATSELLRRLPSALPRLHFGDTDPWGFDVLRALRAAITPVAIAPLHMRFRDKSGAPPLTSRDQNKLTALLAEPALADVRPELERMAAAGSKGDFEQEGILVASGFPYTAEA
jgi:hypothetical protein